MRQWARDPRECEGPCVAFRQENNGPGVTMANVERTVTVRTRKSATQRVPDSAREYVALAEWLDSLSIFDKADKELPVARRGGVGTAGMVAFVAMVPLALTSTLAPFTFQIGTLNVQGSQHRPNGTGRAAMHASTNSTLACNAP